MATRKNVQLPKEWTTAKIRVNPQGKVQVKIAPSKVIVKANARKRGPGLASGRPGRVSKGVRKVGGKKRRASARRRK